MTKMFVVTLVGVILATGLVMAVLAKFNVIGGDDSKSDEPVTTVTPTSSKTDDGKGKGKAEDEVKDGEVSVFDTLIGQVKSLVVRPENLFLDHPDLTSEVQKAAGQHHLIRLKQISVGFQAGRIVPQDTSNDELTAKFGGLSSKVDEQGQRLDAVEQGLEENRQGLEETNKSVEDLGRRCMDQFEEVKSMILQKSPAPAEPSPAPAEPAPASIAEPPALEPVPAPPAPAN